MIEFKKSHPSFEAIHWLTAPLVKPVDGRWHLNHLRVESNQAVATDGRRMHLSKAVSLEDGFYRVLNRTKAKVTLFRICSLDSSEANYPEYDQLVSVPDGEGHRIVCPGAEFPADATHAKLIRLLPDNRCVQFRYIAEVITVMDDDCEVFPPGDCGLIHFVQDNYHAVIMPARC